MVGVRQTKMYIVPPNRFTGFNFLEQNTNDNLRYDFFITFRRLTIFLAENEAKKAEQEWLHIQEMLKNPKYSRTLTEQERKDFRRLGEIIANWHKFQSPWRFAQQQIKPRRDPYEVLEIRRGASEEEARSAYRRLVKSFHPDHNGNSRESTEKFIELQEAHEVLMRGER